MLSKPKENEQKQDKLQTQESIPKKPLVSIITVVFNGEKDLEETILSVINQSYQNIEYIIIDGQSSDGTLDIIRKYNSQIDYWISEPDRGIYDAMNKGIMAASGEIIGLINCGDNYTSNAVEEVIKVYQSVAENQYLVITGAMYRFDAEKNIKFKIVKDREKLQKGINMTMPINHPATFVTKAAYNKLGVFNSNYRICGDYDLIFRMYYSSLVDFVFIDRELAYMKLGGVSEQLDSVWLRCKEHFSIRKERISFLSNILICSYWYLKTISKYFLRNLFKNSLLPFYYSLRHNRAS